MYNDFLTSFQLKKSEIKVTPFAYVDSDLQEIRIVTNLMTDDATEEITAVSIAKTGDIELLTTED